MTPNNRIILAAVLIALALIGIIAIAASRCGPDEFLVPSMTGPVCVKGHR